MAGQATFVDEGQIVHGRKGFGVFIAEAGNAHHELPGFETKALAQRQVAVDVLAEFAALAFDVDWKVPVDQQENVLLIGVTAGGAVLPEVKRN